MLEEYKDRIEHAKNKQFQLLERFHVGDTVYPCWLKNFLIYGIVVDVNTVTRKITCDFNGVQRQFCPEDLMLVNPELAGHSALNAKTASKKASIDNKEYKYYVVLDNDEIESGWEYREDAIDRQKELAGDSVKSKVLSRRTLGGAEADDKNWHKGGFKTASEKETHLSPDTDNGIHAVCKDCGGEIGVSYNEQTAKTDFVCTNCGKRISEDKLSENSKKAMRKAAQKDEVLYETREPVGELDKKSYTHYVILDRDGRIESGHDGQKSADSRMKKLTDDGIPCHVQSRDQLKLRPTDDTHWFRGVIASNKALAKELVAVAKEIANLI